MAKINGELLTPEIYQQQTGLKPVKVPFPDRVVLALNPDGYPHVWAMPLANKHSEVIRWIVSDGPRCRVYMWKSDGLFGCTDNSEDREANAFDSLEEAIQLFNHYYK